MGQNGPEWARLAYHPDGSLPPTDAAKHVSRRREVEILDGHGCQGWGNLRFEKRGSEAERWKMLGTPKLKRCFQLGIHGEQCSDETSRKSAARSHPIHSAGTPVTGASRRAHPTLTVCLLAERV
jgi:hypothetical protein